MGRLTRECLVIGTDSSRSDTRVVDGIEGEFILGDTMDFEVSVPSSARIEKGSLLYIEGTPFGGIVDMVEPTSGAARTVYRGRSFEGILSERVILAPAGKANRTYNGEANDVIRSLVADCDLSWLFSVPSAPSGIAISGKFDVASDVRSGLSKALAASGARLDWSWEGRACSLSAAPIESVVTDTSHAPVTMQDPWRNINHLILFGKGEGADREIVHAYADESGRVGTVQSLFGADHREAAYDYPNSEDAAADVAEKLSELQERPSIVLDAARVEGNLMPGDLITALDDALGTEVTSSVTRAVATVRGGRMSVVYETGALDGSMGLSGGSGASGGGGGISYTAGEGIEISAGVISADVTQAKLDAVEATAAASVSAVSGAAPITAARSGRTVTVGHALSGVVADKYGPNANLAPAFGDTVTIPPQISMDQEGHITQANARTLTIPATTATQTTAGLMSAADKIKLDAGIGDALTKEEADTYYQPIGDYATDADVASAISEATATASTTIQLTNLGSGNHPLRLYRQGHFVYASMTTVVNPASVNTNINTGTVPVGYRPPYPHFQRGTGWTNQQASADFRWYVNAAGAVMFTTTATGQRECQLTTVWWTNDPMPS